MDPLTRAANLESCALQWEADARHYRGRRKEWRLARADHLRTLAWSIVDGLM